MIGRALRIYFSITRSFAPILMCLGSLIGMIISKGTSLDPLETVFPLLSLYFLTAASFLFNDIFDLEVDRANQIKRPLATGELGVKTAWILWIALTTAGLILMVFIKYTEARLLLAFSYILSLLYTLKIKDYGLIGNIVVSLLVSLSLVYGALSVSGGFPLSMFSLVVLAVLLNLSREVIQGIVDAPGDAVRNVRSISRLFGADVAKALGSVLLAAMIMTAPVVVKTSGADLFRNKAMIHGYLLATMGFAYVIYRLWRARDSGEIKRVLNMINILTAVLIALIIVSIAL